MSGIEISWFIGRNTYLLALFIFGKKSVLDTQLEL